MIRILWRVQSLYLQERGTRGEPGWYKMLWGVVME